MIEPVHPVERGEFDGLEMPPRPQPTNHFRLEEPDEGFGERLSYESPRLPTDGAMPASANRSV
jgi:hypothetical protein